VTRLADLADSAVAMPTYAYVCERCTEPMEVVRSIKNPPAARRRCPACAAMTMLRQITGGINTALAEGAKARLFGKYPVVSNRLPFGLKLPGVDIHHDGPLNKVVIESRAHERKVYDAIGAKRGD
jgi:putative FmdB family regulatory protein